MSADKPKPAKPTTKKVFDVEKPSKTAPSTTSRPVIVKNRQIMKDPMMVADSIPDGTEKDAQTPKSAPKKININPPAEGTSSNDGDVDVTTSQSAENNSAEPKPTEVAGAPKLDKAALSEDSKTPDAEIKNQPDETPPDSQPAKPEKTPDENTSDKTATETDDTKPSTGEKSDAKQTAADKAAEEEAERQAKLDKLIENQQYFLPVNAVKKRRARNTLIVVIIIVILVLIWLDLALDSGLIHINGVSPITHFFKY